MRFRGRHEVVWNNWGRRSASVCVSGAKHPARNAIASHVGDCPGNDTYPTDRTLADRSDKEVPVVTFLDSQRFNHTHASRGTILKTGPR